MYKMSSIKYIKSNQIGIDLIEKLALLPFSALGTRRFCLHDSPEAKFHVMLIESKKNHDYPIHAHMDGAELIMIIAGELLIEFVDSTTLVPNEIFFLKAGDSSCTAVLIPQYMAHTTKAQTETTTYLEIKLGPFSREAVKLFRTDD